MRRVLSWVQRRGSQGCRPQSIYCQHLCLSDWRVELLGVKWSFVIIVAQLIFDHTPDSQHPLLEVNGKTDLALQSPCYGLSVTCPSQAPVFEHLVSSWWHCFRRLGKLWVQDAPC